MQQKIINDPISRIVSNASKDVNTFFNLLAPLDFKRSGRTYKCKQSNGLTISKNNQTNEYFVNNFSHKLDVPSGGAWSIAKYVANTDDKKTILRVLAKASNQDYPLDAGNKKFELDYNRVVKKENFVVNSAYLLRKTYNARFDNNKNHAMLKYFKQWGVSAELLKKYNVRALESVTHIESNYTIKFDNKDFAFAYQIDVDKTIKYKRPNAAKDKKERYIQSSGHYVFGYDQLPKKGEAIFICAGEKDTLAFNETFNKYDLYGICLSSEKATLNDLLANELKTRFKHVFTIYDNDLTGIQCSNNIEVDHAIPSIKIGKYTDKNDLSDIIEFEGVEALKRIIALEYQLYKNRCSLSKSIIKLDAKQYVSELLEVAEFESGIYKLVGGTGTGKTRFAATTLHKKFNKVIVVSRNVTTLENYNQYGFIRYKKSHFQSDGDKNDFRNSNRITVSYASLHFLLDDIDISNAVFVFDEYHLLHEVFRGVEKDTTKAYELLLRLKTNTVICMSANESHILDERFEIKKTYRFIKEHVKRNILVKYNASYTRLLELIKHRLSEGRKVLLYTNEKEYNKQGVQRKLAHQIKEHFKDNSILFYNADNNKHALTELQNDITVCTKALVTGKDINTKNIAVIVYCLQKNDFQRSIINQFCGRARHWQTASYDLLFEFKPNNEDYKNMSIDLWHRQTIERAMRIICDAKNDITLFHDNYKKLVKGDYKNMSIDLYRIDQIVNEKVSLYTISNTHHLTDFLRKHGYDVVIENQEKQDKVKAKEKNVSKADLIRLDVEAIEQGNNNLDHTLAAQRIKAVEMITDDMNKAIDLVKEYASDMKFKRLISLITAQARLQTNDSNFTHDYKLIGSIDNYNSLDEIILTIAKMKFKTLRLKKFSRTAKQAMKKDCTTTKRYIKKELDDMFLIDSRRKRGERLYQLKTPFFTDSIISLKLLKKLTQLID